MPKLKIVCTSQGPHCESRGDQCRSMDLQFPVVRAHSINNAMLLNAGGSPLSSSLSQEETREPSTTPTWHWLSLFICSVPVATSFCVNVVLLEQTDGKRKKIGILRLTFHKAPFTQLPLSIPISNFNFKFAFNFDLTLSLNLLCRYVISVNKSSFHGVWCRSLAGSRPASRPPFIILTTTRR